MGRTAEEVSDDLTAEFIWDDAWLGGSCLQISGATEQTYLQLFKTKYSTANSGDYMTIRYKVLSGSGTLSWACSKEGDEATAVERVIKTNATVESASVKTNVKISNFFILLSPFVLCEYYITVFLFFQ